MLQRFNQYYCVSQENKTDLNINWKSFFSKQMEMGKLKTLFSRAYDICSTEKYLKEELNHIESL